MERLQRLGAEVIDQTMPRRNQLPLQRLRERFDAEIRALPGIAVPADNPLSLGKSAGALSGRESDLYNRVKFHEAIWVSSPFLKLERQIRALRFAFGITGLLEYVEAAAISRLRPRPLGAHELYLAGLYAERETKNQDEARSNYELGLKSSDPILTNRIQRRLQDLNERAGKQTTKP